jgi:hypothetical protein
MCTRGRTTPTASPAATTPRASPRTRTSSAARARWSSPRSGRPPSPGRVAQGNEPTRVPARGGCPVPHRASAPRRRGSRRCRTHAGIDGDDDADGFVHHLGQTARIHAERAFLDVAEQHAGYPRARTPEPSSRSRRTAAQSCRPGTGRPGARSILRAAVHDVVSRRFAGAQRLSSKLATLPENGPPAVVWPRSTADHISSISRP